MKLGAGFVYQGQWHLVKVITYRVETWSVKTGTVTCVMVEQRWLRVRRGVASPLWRQRVGIHLHRGTPTASLHSFPISSPVLFPSICFLYRDISSFPRGGRLVGALPSLQRTRSYIWFLWEAIYPAQRRLKGLHRCCKVSVSTRTLTVWEVMDVRLEDLFDILVTCPTLPHLCKLHRRCLSIWGN